MRHDFGISGQPAPDFRVETWLANVDNEHGLRLSDIDEPIIYLYNFQSWCPGCHSHGFPAMAAVKEHLEQTQQQDKVKFVAIQTVFEGHDENTADAAIESINRHGLGDVSLGHDTGEPPTIMADYRTGGTPWTVLIGPGPERLVLADGFQAEASGVIGLIEQILDRGSAADLAPAAGTPLDHRLDDSFARDVPELQVRSLPARVPAPVLIAWNPKLAVELGLDPDELASDQGIETLVGNAVPAGVSPTAMAYAGHQFGGFSPVLGDGRAVLLGEITDAIGERRDIHLKGSGRTPFSRGGDGKAELGSMLREYIMAEAMHALGVPTTRALAVVATGEHVHREGAVLGAVLSRVAASHIRVGTFEFAARRDDETILRRLADHAIERHYPSVLSTEGNRYIALLDAVIDSQASLISRWMLVGFIHGVMNTDNVTISGETIDYGPCAFMDRYNPRTVYSSIDHMGRYAYGNQPMITQWNLARFAETLLPLVDSDNDVATSAVTEVLATFTSRYEQYWRAGMASKLGLVSDGVDDQQLFDDLLDLLRSERADFTGTFRALASWLTEGDEALRQVFGNPSATRSWTRQWKERLETQGRDLVAVASGMGRVNPIYIPRNHLVDEALEAANRGDIDPFNALLEAVTHPFDECADFGHYANAAPAWFDETFKTYCGT